MELVLSWVVFPGVLVVLACGAGALVGRVAGVEVPGALVPGVGLAGLIVLAEFPALSDATAEYIVPVAVGAAVLGFVLVREPRRTFAIEPPVLLAALGVFAVYAAPVVLSGEATFAGYVKLDDTATWMAIVDRIMEHGRSLEGLAPSSYEATLDFNLGDGYPIGAFLPLGIGARLAGQDVAWVIQPYIALFAGLLALAIGELLRGLLSSAWLRAVVAFVAAQSALLVGYALWGGVKEVAAAMLLALVAALAARALPPARVREAVPVAVVSVALLGVLSPLGAGGKFLPPTARPLTDAAAKGNLIEPLSPLQLGGIWPSDDFRLDPDYPEATYALLGAAAALAVLGIAAAIRARAWALLIYGAGALAGFALISLLGSPWVAGKATATASPAVLALALVGAAGLAVRGRRLRRIAGAAGLAALAAGVLWSNALADPYLAPRDRLAELQEIGELIAGRGPALMTEYEPYGVRHFLREADPEGVSELRRRTIPLRSGRTARKGESVDVRRVAWYALRVYRTLVLRRPPANSRPPAAYRLVWRGEFYDVWVRAPRVSDQPPTAVD